jgi:hypothetical protein
VGINDREQDQKANRRAQRKQQRSRRAGSSQANWDAYDWVRTVALVRALVTMGGALRIGQTRDGGAWALGIYVGDDYATEYIRPSEDFAAAIDEIATAWGVSEGYAAELEALLRAAK